MRTRRLLGTVVMVGTLVLAACGGVGGGTGSAPAQGGGDASPQAGGGTGAPTPAALDFTVATVDGGTFDGADLAGGPAVLWFWAPWCVVCAGQAAEVSALAQEYDGRAAVVGVAGLDGSVDAMRDFVARTGVAGLVHLADVDGVVWRRFGITAQSTFVVLDRTGAVVARDLPGPEQVREWLPQVTG